MCLAEETLASPILKHPYKDMRDGKGGRKGKAGRLWGCRPSSDAHSSSRPRGTRLRVPCPNRITSFIQLSGSRVWIRASRVWLPAPWGANRPWAPGNIKQPHFSSHKMLRACQLRAESVVLKMWSLDRYHLIC